MFVSIFIKFDITFDIKRIKALDNYKRKNFVYIMEFILKKNDFFLFIQSTTTINYVCYMGKKIYTNDEMIFFFKFSVHKKL